MTNQHPLTTTQIKELVRRYTFDMSSGEYFFGEDAVRAAADWQLEQVIEFIKKEDTVYAEYIYEAMRPQLQENN
jgi:hypothetical protein